MSHTTKPLPVTRESFRYCWGEDDVPLCKIYIEELNKLELKQRINQPTFIKRRVIPTEVRLSESDRAPQLKLEENCTRVTGEKGYSIVRANHAVNRGKYYFEVHIDSMGDNTATRIGWGQQYSNLQAPLGYDPYGYSWRSRLGTKFHTAIGKTFDKEGGYKQGDTIGCMIELPYGNRGEITVASHLPVSVKGFGFVVRETKKKDSYRVIEEPNDSPSLDRIGILKGSKISFYKNGRFVGVAFEDIFNGFYYPSISLYKDCTVTANFGATKFRYPPEEYNPDSKNHLFYKPIQEVVEISIIDHFLSDLITIVDQENGPCGKNLLSEMIEKASQGISS